MKHFGRKLALVLVACGMFVMVSCDGNKTHSTAEETRIYVEPNYIPVQWDDQTGVSAEVINEVDESVGVVPICGVVESFTSGVIAEGQPLRVKFFGGLKLKRQYGEVLPSNIFRITPKLAGEAYWIDENTIGYRMKERAQRWKGYNVSVDLNNFVDISGESDLKFGFAVNYQDFDIADLVVEGLENSVNLMFTLGFANPVTADEALSMLDENILAEYSCSAEKSNRNMVMVRINDIPATRKSYDLDVVFDGKKINVGKKVERKVHIVSEPAFRVTGQLVDKENRTVTLLFSRKLQANQNLDGYVNLNASLNKSLVINDNRLMLSFDNNWNFRNVISSHSLNISFSKNIRSADGSKLDEDYVINGLDMKCLIPEISWADDGYIVPETSDATLYFNAACLNAVIVRIIRIYDNNALSFLQENTFEGTYGIRRYGRLEKKVKVMLANDNSTEKKTYPLKLSDYVDVKPGDMFQVEIAFDPSCYMFANDIKANYEKMENYDESDYWDNNSYGYAPYYWEEDGWSYRDDPKHLGFYNGRDISRNMVVSNIGLTVKYSDESNPVVFVHRISDAAPMNKVKITSYNYQKQVLEQTLTNSEGIAMLNSKESMYYIVAEDGKDKAYFVPRHNSSLEMSKFDVSGVGVSTGIMGFAYSNRDIWRPGDELQLNLMVSSNEQQLPENYPVVLRIYDASNRLYDQQTNNNPVGGIYRFSVKTSASDATGRWWAVYCIGNNSVTQVLRIETVKPNRLEIMFKAADTIRTADKNLDVATLSAKWLNGLTASKLSASVEANISETKTAFKDFNDYEFVNEAVSKSTITTEIFKDNLAEDGSREISLDKLRESNLSGMAFAKFNLKVFEPEGDFSTTTYTSVVSPFENYVGVRMPKTRSTYGDYYFVDEDVSFDVALVSEYGKLNRKSTDLNYTLYKLDNYWWWSADNGYQLKKYVTGSVKQNYRSGTISCRSGEGKLTLNIPKNDWGYYLLVIGDGDKGYVWSKVIEFDWSYSNHSTSSSGAPALLTLKSEKTNFEVGETLHLKFPANEGSKAIVTIEAANRILKTINLNSLTSDNQLDIPITAEMVPNVYVYVSLLQRYDQTADLPIRLYGLLPITVKNPKSVLTPVLTVPDEASSNQKIEIKVSETNGTPMAYTIAIVDEGLLGISNYRTPNPFNYFFRKQALGIRTWDNYNDIIDVFTGSLSSVYVVGGDEEYGMLFCANENSMKAKSRNLIEEELRKRLSAVAQTIGPFELKAGQTNTHEYTIPSYIGSLRVMVVACNSEQQAYGSTQKNIRVKDPVMILTTAPRIVAPKDKVNIPVQIFAPDSKLKNVDLTFEAINMTINKGNVKSVKLDANGEATVNLEAVISETSADASLNVVAKADGYQAVSNLVLPTRPSYVTKYSRTIEKIGAGETKTINLDVEGFDGTRKGEIMANTAIPINLMPRLDYLTSYPHGCLEQVTSKVFAQLYVDKFVDMDADDKARVNKNINDGIGLLKNYLNPNYSMNNWVGGSYVNSWTEIYALHFLIEAKKQGYEVPADMLNGMIKYQSSKARSWNYNPDAVYTETIQAYRLFVLSLANKAETGAMNRFKELDMKYSLSRVLMASAYANIGKTKIAKNMLAGANIKGSMSDYYTSFGSGIRDKAFYAFAEMQLGEDENVVYSHIVEICDAINSEEWLDTQTTAMSLFVLGKYASMIGFEGGALTISASINGKELNVSTNRNNETFAFEPLRETNKLNVTNNGKSAIYVMMTGSGLVLDEITKEDGYILSMKAEYINEDGTEVNPSKMNKGTDFYVRLTVSNTCDYPVTENALTYQLPGGWQIVGQKALFGKPENDKVCKHIDQRDDLIHFYFDLMPHETKTMFVKVNATYAGTYTLPSVACEDMYNNKIFYTIPSRVVEVR